MKFYQVVLPQLSEVEQKSLAYVKEHGSIKRKAARNQRYKGKICTLEDGGSWAAAPGGTTEGRTLSIALDLDNFWTNYNYPKNSISSRRIPVPFQEKMVCDIILISHEDL